MKENSPPRAAAGRRLSYNGKFKVTIIAYVDQIVEVEASNAILPLRSSRGIDVIRELVHSRGFFLQLTVVFCNSESLNGIDN